MVRRKKTEKAVFIALLATANIPTSVTHYQLLYGGLKTFLGGYRVANEVREERRTLFSPRVHGVGKAVLTLCSVQEEEGERREVAKTDV